MKYCLYLTGIMICFLSTTAHADWSSIPLLTSSSSTGEVTYNVSLKILLGMALLTVLPALLMTMTSFTRIIIVFSILRQAIGIPNVPSNQILVGLSLIMTVFVMMPVFNTINESSINPYMKGTISDEVAIERIGASLRMFLLKQTRKADLNMFLKLAKTQASSKEPPMFAVIPAFITSELKTAFQIGFLIFIPFLIIDLVTASILMSMGMMMLSPMMISLPFKIIFFVLVNGWSLMVTSLISSFRL
ncbi:flagellar biosynthesis protein flip [Legionella norrlandica]|uniref:Flagellar biosynthetic protein FliP n=1 Tax=Legionella norrlandica TaxID=1498499 RepID=A0A0A2SRG0_9GAMM|nr:flagellar biosynthesis protein flip [Legionella norrlandica]